MTTHITLVFCPICESGCHVAGGLENMQNMHPVECVAGDYCDYTEVATLKILGSGKLRVSNLDLELCRRRADSWRFSAFENPAFHPAINNWIESVHQNGCREVQVAH